MFFCDRKITKYLKVKVVIKKISLVLGTSLVKYIIRMILSLIRLLYT